MGARLGFADVLTSKLVDVPPPVARGGRESRIASPAWVLRLEPLCVASASFLHMRYPHLASAAPAAGGIPMEATSSATCGSSSAPSAPAPAPAVSRPARRAVSRTPRERLAMQMLNRLGASLDATATDEDVKRAYRQLVRETHPDRHQDAPATLDAHAQRLRAVIRAWDLFQGREVLAA